ncbi:MAG TPA: hypothetical protein PK771_06910 [Spirochaetota bacterium]|nr:hypothetical protein [Spirochaetota bacterium]
MGFIYFFKNINGCERFLKELRDEWSKYLKIGEKFNGVEYYLIEEWISSKEKGANIEWLNSIKVRHIKFLNDLPYSAGVYISSYGGKYEEIEYLKKEGINFVENICPWVKLLIRELQKVKNTHQCVIMIDEDHMVRKNYDSLIPGDTIIVNEENFKDMIKNKKNNKPLHFIVYNTFRPIEAERVKNFIETNYPNVNNIFQLKTSCGWVTKSGLFEEITDTVVKKKIDEIWIICGGRLDRSTKSIINHIKELNVDYQLIREITDIPSSIQSGRNIGVLKVPVPYHKANEIIEVIKERYSNILIE